MRGRIRKRGFDIEMKISQRRDSESRDAALRRYVFSAKARRSLAAWDNAPGIRAMPKPPALKARFIPAPIWVGLTGNLCVESRFQRWSIIRSESWGDAPAGMRARLWRSSQNLPCGRRARRPYQQGQMMNAAKITRESKSNLAFAFVSLGRERREDITIFYAFCRVIDDIADSTELTVQEKARDLTAWRRWLRESSPDEPAIGTGSAPIDRKIFTQTGHAGGNYRWC